NLSKLLRKSTLWCTHLECRPAMENSITLDCAQPTRRQCYDDAKQLD
uniref:Uncharacterized protein n=1 Tax=Caenorhabditis japonica TaxID=281687 RepID=A0A8R1EK03_CAEJA